MVAGEPNKNIAMDLGLAKKTVKVHRARVMQKMGMRNLADLVRAAVTRRIGAP
ncbi:LuxR C-terminal-related transcriptional regulator [Dinoroseobacter shibae]|nr:LuxR C-terminal-related transcriptional regulator [Dinoroseobacter shibae]